MCQMDSIKYKDTLHVQSISKWAPVCVGPYSQCCVVRGALCYLAGGVGLLPEDMVIVRGGWEVEVRNYVVILLLFVANLFLSYTSFVLLLLFSLKCVLLNERVISKTISPNISDESYIDTFASFSGTNLLLKYTNLVLDFINFIMLSSFY